MKLEDIEPFLDRPVNILLPSAGWTKTEGVSVRGVLKIQGLDTLILDCPQVGYHNKPIDPAQILEVSD